MRILVTGADSELGRELLRQLSFSDHQVTGLIKRESTADTVRKLGADPRVVDLGDALDLDKVLYETEPQVLLNVAPQRTNTLLHDGQAWGNIAHSLPAQTAALLQAASDSSVSYMVHASYAFLYGPAVGDSDEVVDESSPINSPKGNKLFTAAVEAEKMVAASREFPACILRIGYLYGPQSRDLALYEISFKAFRPYYAGPQKHLGSFVHFNDAARALVLAAEKQPANEIINVVDGTPVSFGTFIDYYAHCLGHKKPRRIPKILVRFAPIIAAQQIKQLDIHGAQVSSSKAHELLGWAPEFPSYEQGLVQTVQVQRGQKD